MSDAMENAGSNGSIFYAASGGADRWEDAAHEYGRKIADAASKTRDYVGEKVACAGEKFKELQNKDLNEVVDNAKAYARKNPGQAILISAAAGLFLGLLLRSVRR
jgi:ElaB/YqjD/DUF883 family membrane-anchored ribosome-binding protein